MTPHPAGSATTLVRASLALVVLLTACRPDGATTPTPAQALGFNSTPGQTQRMGEARVRAIQLAVKESFPELLVTRVEGGEATVFLILNRGKVERKLLRTSRPPSPFSTSDALRMAFPDEAPRALARAGVHSLRAGDGGPNAIAVFWWERQSADDDAADGPIRMAESPVSDVQVRAAIQRHHPEAYSADQPAWFIATVDGVVLKTGVATREMLKNSMIIGEHLKSQFPGIKLYSMVMTNSWPDAEKKGNAIPVAWAILASDSPLPR